MLTDINEYDKLIFNVIVSGLLGTYLEINYFIPK